MRSFKLFVLVLAVLLVAVSCTTTGQKQPQLVGETHIGTQGIDFNFLPNYPPSIIYISGQPGAGIDAGDTGTNVVLEVKNIGSFTTQVYFYLSGFDPKILTNIQPQQVIGQIEGKSPTNPEGGYTQIQFPSYSTLRAVMPKGIDVYPLTLQATACYDYETMASLPICVDPNPYSPVTQKACVPHGATVGGGQGAPIAITSVEQESLKNRVILKIRIANSAGGQVIKKGTAGLCTNLQYDKLNIIDQYTFKLGGQTGNCLPAAPLRITNNQALITCDFSATSAGDLAYTTTLDADLKYGYMYSKQKSIQIRKI